MPEPTSNLTPDYTWDERSSRYRDKSTGRYVSQERIRGALDGFIENANGRIEMVTNQLINGEISLADWQTQMATTIKDMHLAAASSARGGWAQMSPSDFGFTGSLIKNQYGFLQNFANEIASGEQPLNLNALRRAHMYGQAARGTHEDMRRRIMRDKGATHEQRILGIAEHCTTRNGLLGCVELAALGWKVIGTLPRIGNSPCKVNCHCRFRFGRQLDNGKIEVIG